ncbi:lysophospholipid acyltransferase family protein [Histidinibacterium aquaticum]|uniref:Lauroyl acyltransferase n=1 Tax=Histidinibacterium aquaticum TaxID=2613962 RepID=A0A5J5GN41_9RHOB|nr:lauroyl acyltransferase [Histidinibacterium aquaticum]KAA9009477.1 lauroyl acyltransferase [Histidinibacterium aquaticum]
MAQPGVNAKDRLVDIFARSALGLALLLPYRARVQFFGWFFSAVVAPLAGWRRRIERNLAYAMPELDRAQRAVLARKVPDNFGRCLIEMYSGKELLERLDHAPLSGPGLAPLEEAHLAGRPVVLVTAHFGSYDAARAALGRRGFEIAGLYRPMSNAAFNAHYVEAMSTIGGPLFATDKRGVVGLVKYLKAGGKIGILADVRTNKAPLLSFFGKPAHTSLAAAEWAVRYDALFLPVFGVRQDDGLGFDIWVERPIALGTPRDMMQAYNDIVETKVRERPEQWFWIHNRWKLASRKPKRTEDAEPAWRDEQDIGNGAIGAE